MRFWRRPLLLRQELVRNPQLPFPAVTLCNMNAVRRTAWEEYLKGGQLDHVKEQLETGNLLNAELGEVDTISGGDSGSGEERSRRKRAAG